MQGCSSVRTSVKSTCHNRATKRGLSSSSKRRILPPVSISIPSREITVKKIYRLAMVLLLFVLVGQDHETEGPGGLMSRSKDDGKITHLLRKLKTGGCTTLGINTF